MKSFLLRMHGPISLNASVPFLSVLLQVLLLGNFIHIARDNLSLGRNARI